MGTERTRVVVTGVGAITPLGATAPSTWEAMLAGRSGVTALTDDWAAELPARIAAWAAADPATLIDRVQARRLDRCEQFALIAAREAWADAGAPEVDGDRLGVAVSSGIGGIASTLSAYDTLREKGWQRLSPFTVPMLMPNGAAGWISIELGAKAGVHCSVSACASGAEAIGYAIDMIRSGRADVVVAGGTEAAIIQLNLAAFAAMRAISTRNDEPAARVPSLRQGSRRVRPRRGRRHRRARVRGARRGPRRHASTRSPPGPGTRPTRTTSPSPTRTAPGSAARCAGRWPTPAWPRAGRARQRARHLDAAGDVAEAQAVAAVLGDAAPGVVMSATKSMTGHLLGGAGAIESVASILALRDQIAPPTINLEDPDDDGGLTISAEPQELRARTAEPMAVLNDSFGFGGANVALAFTAS